MPYLKVGNAQRPEIIEKDSEQVLEVWCKDSLVEPGLGNNTLIWKASEEFEIESNGSCTTLNCASYIEANKEYESTSRFTLTFVDNRGLIETGDLTVYDEVTINILPGVQISGNRGASSGSVGGDAIKITNGSSVIINNAGKIYGAGGNGGKGGNGTTSNIPAAAWGGHRACYIGATSTCVPTTQPGWHLDQRWTKKSNGGWAWIQTGCTSQQFGGNSQYGTWGDQQDTTLQSGHPHYGRIKFSYHCGGGKYALYYQTSKTVKFVGASGGAGGLAAGCNGSLTSPGGGKTGYLSGSGFSSSSGDNITTSYGNNAYINATKSGAGGPAGGWGQSGTDGVGGGSGGASGLGIRVISGSIAPGSSTGDVLPAI